MISPNNDGNAAKPHSAQPVRVGLFVTCLVDSIRPSIGLAAATLLEAAGCEVDAPEMQTCCGQPAYNSGDTDSACAVAQTILTAFADHDYVVVPSGSCAAMIKRHIPTLFQHDPERAETARQIGAKTYELISFLVDVRRIGSVGAQHRGAVTYHDACSGLRELGIHRQPRQLLSGVDGLELVEMTDSKSCCGFGGMFCMKYDEISNAIVDRKCHDIAETGANMVLSGDLGCLLNIAGKLSRQGQPITARHIAEILAGQTDEPALGKA